jgi:hypothetical protein
MEGTDGRGRQITSQRESKKNEKKKEAMVPISPSRAHPQ